jgi:hypothetical protein
MLYHLELFEIPISLFWVPLCWKVALSGTEKIS